MARKIFLSYSRADDETHAVSAFVRLLTQEYRRLTGEPLELFFDTENIRPGMVWEQTIKNEITNSDLFILVLTPSSLKSEWCRKEVQFFAERERSLIAKRNWPPEQGLLFPVKFVELDHMILSESEKDFWKQLSRWQVFDLLDFSPKRYRDLQRVRVLVKQIVTSINLPAVSPIVIPPSSYEPNPARVFNLDTSSRINGLIFGSFWDERNKFRDLNFSILRSWAEHRATTNKDAIHPFVHTATRTAFL